MSTEPSDSCSNPQSRPSLLTQTLTELGIPVSSHPHLPHGSKSDSSIGSIDTLMSETLLADPFSASATPSSSSTTVVFNDRPRQKCQRSVSRDGDEGPKRRRTASVPPEHKEGYIKTRNLLTKFLKASACQDNLAACIDTNNIPHSFSFQIPSRSILQDEALSKIWKETLAATSVQLLRLTRDHYAKKAESLHLASRRSLIDACDPSTTAEINAALEAIRQRLSSTLNRKYTSRRSQNASSAGRRGDKKSCHTKSRSRSRRRRGPGRNQERNRHGQAQQGAPTAAQNLRHHESAQAFFRELATAFHESLKNKDNISPVNNNNNANTIKTTLKFIYQTL